MYVAGPGQQALLDDSRLAMEATCPGLRVLTRDEALSRVPCLRPDAVAAALLDDDAQDIDVHALHQGFLRGFKGQGGQLRCNAGLQRAVRAGDHWDLRLADGTALRCRILVNAAGAWADAVAASCGASPIGLEPRRRTAFTYRPPAGVDASRGPCVADLVERGYFKPDAGQLLGSPANADPVAAHDVQAEELDVATGIARIEAATTLQIRRPSHIWAGLRSFVRDGELVIGWDDACPGFFWLAGQGGYGIQSAAGASALAAAQLLGSVMPRGLGKHGVDPVLLSPSRLRPR